MQQPIHPGPGSSLAPLRMAPLRHLCLLSSFLLKVQLLVAQARAFAGIAVGAGAVELLLSGRRRLAERPRPVQAVPAVRAVPPQPSDPQAAEHTKSPWLSVRLCHALGSGCSTLLSLGG